MHALANPTRFLRFARPATSWLLLIGIALVIAGMGAGLALTPPDYLQGETVRILYIHVPSAWLGMAGWIGIAAAAVSQLVWRHPLAAVAGRAVAPAGATFAGICLITGSIWGRPTWGTWWEWDGRLTSMLVLYASMYGWSKRRRMLENVAWFALSWNAPTRTDPAGTNRNAAAYAKKVNVPTHAMEGRLRSCTRSV